MPEAAVHQRASEDTDGGAGVGQTLTVDRGSQPLLEWLRSSGDALCSELPEHGSVLLRSSAPLAVPEFRAALSGCLEEMLDSAGEHVPIGGHAQVYNPVRYPPERRLLWHNENSFNFSWPDIIAFGCVRPADRGGETLLADCRAVLGALDPAVVQEFRSRGVQYVRRMGLGVDRHWKQIYGTDSKQQAESRCLAQGCTFRWLRDDVLETAATRDATLLHPVTGSECWFSQVQHWHQRCLDEEDRRELTDLFGEESLPRDCRYGDGARIPDAVVDHILATYAAQGWQVPCRTGDILILDNLLTAHGRNAYAGRRELLVAMGRRRAARQ